MCYFNSHIAINGGKQVFSNRQPVKYRRYFTKNHDHDSCVGLSSMCAPLPYLLSGHSVSSFQVLICHLQIDSGAFASVVVTVYSLLLS